MGNMNSIIPTAEPFFFPGRKDAPGVLLIHGFTGTPKEMRWMGETLHREYGFSVLGPRLAGHATRPEDMIRSRYTDWLASAEDGYRLLSGVTREITLCGLSMGGIISLTLAASLPVKGVIAMATPYGLPSDWRLNHIKLLSKIQPYMPKNKEEPGSGWFDQEAWRDHVAYPQNPVRAISELKDLAAVMRAGLPQVTAPALLVYSRDDIYLPNGSLESMEYIYDHLGSKTKEKLVISGSGHVIPRDAQRRQVFKAAAEFILRLGASQ